jgi:hypothetical protein
MNTHTMKIRKTDIKISIGESKYLIRYVDAFDYCWRLYRITDNRGFEGFARMYPERFDSLTAAMIHLSQMF